MRPRSARALWFRACSEAEAGRSWELPRPCPQRPASLPRPGSPSGSAGGRRYCFPSACSSPAATMAARTPGAALRLCATGTGLAGEVRVGAGTLPGWGRAWTGRGVPRDIPHRGSFLPRGLPETSVTRGKDEFSFVRF